MKEENYLYNAKNPADYIARSLESKISSGKKAVITHAWLEKTGYKIEDIQYARNRNSYWKQLKLKGSKMRNRRRLDEHAYSSGERVSWTEKRLFKFIEMTENHKDYELAKYFKTTIPSIQYLRRKYHSSKFILSKQGKRITPQQLCRLMLLNEKKLSELARGR